MDKVIFVDCDGVLLDWESAFHAWMEKRGHVHDDSLVNSYKMSERFGLSLEEGRRSVRDFNESAAIGYLHPFRDSAWYVPMLHRKYGYRFICITSLSLDPYAHKLRMRNLDRVFGRGVIEELICLDVGADKDNILRYYGSRHPGALWVEDKPENADAGSSAGLSSVLMSHPHNATYTGPATLVEDWRGVHDYLLSH